MIRTTSTRSARVIGGSVAAAAVLAIGAALLLGDDATDPDEGGGAATPHASQDANRTPVRGLLPPAPFEEYAAVGERVRYGDGVSAELADGRLIVSHGGDRREAVLADVSGGPTLSRTPLQLGQAGEGFVVRQGTDDLSVLTVYVPTGDGTLVPAPVRGGVPIGTGRTVDGDAYTSWTTESGGQLFTAVRTPGSKTATFEVYRWEATGPGEGGGAPDDTSPAMLPTSLGEVCFDSTTTPTAAWRC